jgi:DNA-binding transcriptional ArsR family regulator
VPVIPSNATFRALADQTRRDILKMLRAGPRTSGEIASRFDSSWPTISRHLAVLRDGGLVVAERQGQEIHYELNTSVFQDLVRHLMDWSATKPVGAAGRSRATHRSRRQQEV